MKKRSVRYSTRDRGDKVPPPYHVGIGRLFFTLHFGEFAMLTPSTTNFVLAEVCRNEP